MPAVLTRFSRGRRSHTVDLPARLRAALGAASPSTWNLVDEQVNIYATSIDIAWLWQLAADFGLQVAGVDPQLETGGHIGDVQASIGLTDIDPRDPSLSLYGVVDTRDSEGRATSETFYATAQMEAVDGEWTPTEGASWVGREVTTYTDEGGGCVRAAVTLTWATSTGEVYATYTRERLETAPVSAREEALTRAATLVSRESTRAQARAFWTALDPQVEAYRMAGGSSLSTSIAALSVVVHPWLTTGVKAALTGVLG